MTVQAAAATPAAPAGLRQRRFRLAAGTPAAALAAATVRDLAEEWKVPVNRALAAVLASDLVINATLNSEAETLTLAVRCTGRKFRVEVHSAAARGRETAAPGPDAQRGLQLAAALSAEWGHYQTPAGRAVFYVLEPPPDAAADGGQPSTKGEFMPPPPATALPA